MKYDEINDNELIHMIREETEEAKNILFEKYKYIMEVEVKKYASMARTLNYDLNDLYQEALVGFSNAINDYRDDKDMKISSFITLCVDRRLQTIIKKASRYKNRIIADAISLEHIYSSYTSPLMDLLSDNSENDPLENILKEEDLKELMTKIKDNLSDNEYEVYSLMINGLKYNDIATLLGKDLKQVDNTVQRVKNKIKKIVQEKVS